VNGDIGADINPADILTFDERDLDKIKINADDCKNEPDYGPDMKFTAACDIAVTEKGTFT
jgi:hypothetical protein